MRVGLSEVCCQSSTMMIIAIVAFASILVILFCRFRENTTHVATTSGVCPTPPIDRFSIGAGRFRVHRRSFVDPHSSA